MAVISHIDGPNRLIYLHADTVNMEVHPIDIYKEMRVLRKLDENLRNFDVFLTAYGNVAKGGGKFTERYVVENSGTRIIPYDVTGFLTVIGTIITDDGFSGIDCFDGSSLANQVDINYVPPQVEIITVAVGSGLSVEEATTLQFISDILEGDMMPTPTEFKILHKLSKNILVRKDASVVDGLTQLSE